MKINGEAVAPRVEEVLVLPRGDKQIVFLACAVDMGEFDKICPAPVPPVKVTPKGAIPMLDDPGYKQIMANHVAQRGGYMVIHSLTPSNIEWDTVKLDDPTSWANWTTDLKNAGFVPAEINHITHLVLDANCLNEAKIDRARELFLLGKLAASDATTSQSTAPVTSPSGEPASV